MPWCRNLGFKVDGFKAAGAPKRATALASGLARIPGIARMENVLGGIGDDFSSHLNSSTPPPKKLMRGILMGILLLLRKWRWWGLECCNITCAVATAIGRQLRCQGDVCGTRPDPPSSVFELENVMKSLGVSVGGIRVSFHSCLKYSF